MRFLSGLCSRNSMYVRVHGHLRTFQNKLNVVAFSVRYVPRIRLRAGDVFLIFEF